MSKNEQYERYILYQLELIEEKILSLRQNKDEYSENDYWWLYNRYCSQKDILTILLTAHDNKYEIEKINNHDQNKRGNTTQKSNKTTPNSRT